MQLKTVDGKLTLGSVYKLFVAGWIVSWGLLFGAIFLLVVLVAVLTGQTTVNGQTVEGVGPALKALSPFAVLFPVIIVIQGFMFAGLLTFGVWVFQLRRPLTIIGEDQPKVA